MVKPLGAMAVVTPEEVDQDTEAINARLMSAVAVYPSVLVNQSKWREAHHVVCGYEAKWVVDDGIRLVVNLTANPWPLGGLIPWWL